MIRIVKSSLVSIIVGILNLSTMLRNLKVARTLTIFSLSALVLVGMAGTGAAVTGLVAEWHFNGSAQDTSGSGNHGTINGATFVQGISGQALSFDGVDDHVSVPSATLSGTTRTIDFWVYFRNISTAPVIIRKGSDTFYIQAAPAEDLNGGWYIGGLGAPGYFGDSSTKVPLNQWTHYAFVTDGTTMTLYMNGQKKASKAGYFPSDTGEFIIIGANNADIYTAYRVDGLIDEVRIFNRALSDSEIQAEYNAYSTPKPTTVQPTTVQPTTVPPTPDIGTVPPTIVPSTAVPPKPVTTPGKFRVGPSVTLRPVTDVIEVNQDGIVELFMNNPSLNDVTLNVDARISVPSGIHVYGESFGQAAGAGVVAGTFSVPPGTSRTIILTIKADRSARIGSHTIQFTGLYYPGDNKDAYQPMSLTYSVTVKEPSTKPEEPPKEAKANASPSETPGFGVILAIFGVFAIARLLSRK